MKVTTIFSVCQIIFWKERKIKKAVLGLRNIHLPEG